MRNKIMFVLILSTILMFGCSNAKTSNSNITNTTKTVATISNYDLNVFKIDNLKQNNDIISGTILNDDDYARDVNLVIKFYDNNSKEVGTMTQLIQNVNVGDTKPFNISIAKKYINCSYKITVKSAK